jgi:Bacterial Ig-like domain (group 3)
VRLASLLSVAALLLAVIVALGAGQRQHDPHGSGSKASGLLESAVPHQASNAALHGLLAQHPALAAAKTLAGLPASVQRSVDRTLAKQPQASPAGVQVKWKRHGQVSFSEMTRTGATAGGTLALRPTSVSRDDQRHRALTAGGFVFADNGTSESLGSGLSTIYRVTETGVEQQFKLTRRPAGSGHELTLAESLGGALRAVQSGPGTIGFIGKHGVALSYGALKVTDAKGRILPAHMALAGRTVKLVIDDSHASYPLTVDPLVTPSPTLSKSFPGSGAEKLGADVAVSSDGQTVAVGAPTADSGAGAVLVFTESDGTWSTNPVVLNGTGTEALGVSVAISADGGAIIASAPAGDAGAGAAEVFRETDGSWSNTPTTATLTNSSPNTLTGSVSMSADGNTAVVGAGLSSAVVFADEAGSWVNQTTLSTPSITGLAMSADGQTIVVGSAGSSAAGEVVVFSAPDGAWSGNNVTQQTLTSSGSSLLGESVAVSADGQTVVAGAPLNDSRAGAAIVFAETDGSWSQTVALSDSSADLAGESVAISANGQTVAAGAPSTNSDAGEVLLYNASGGSWPSTPSDVYNGTSGEQLGSSVALSGSGQTLALGADQAGSQNGVIDIYNTAVPGFAPAQTVTGGAGEAFGAAEAISADGQTIAIGAVGGHNILVYSETDGGWSLVRTLTAPASWGPQPGLGASLGISADGKTIVAGATAAENASNSVVGAVGVFTQSDGSWADTSQTTPTTSLFGTAQDLDFGAEVAISANAETIAVGMPLAGTSDNGQLAVYAATDGTWPASATQTYTGTALNNQGEELGQSVAVSGDGRTVIAGAPEAGSTSSGAVDIITNSTGSWPSSPTTTLAGTMTATGFGMAVAISADGNTIAAGEPTSNLSFSTSTETATVGGGVAIYSASTGTWENTANLTDPSLEGLGDAVALSGDGSTLVAGADETGSTLSLSNPDPTPAAGGGALYKGSNGNWPSTPTVTDIGSGSDALLGFSVAISGDGQTATIGSPESATASGSVSIYSQLPTTATTVNAVKVGFSPKAQNVTLSAAVTSTEATVGAGSVTFAVKSSSGTTIGTPVTASVSVGTASGSYTLPAGTAPGNYTIDATYSDGGATFGSSTAVAQTLTVDQSAQTITFTGKAPSSPRFGSTYRLAASSSAGVTPLNFTVKASPSGSCTLKGSTVTFKAVGRCLITATQAGNADYTAAEATRTVVVPKEKTSIKLMVAKNDLAVTVKAPSGTPTGKVVVKAGRKTLGTRKLSGGIAVIKHSFKSGTVIALKVTYGGSSQYLKSSLSKAVVRR